MTRCPLKIDYQILPYPINEGELVEFLTALSRITVDCGVEISSGSVVRAVRGAKYQAEVDTARLDGIPRQIPQALSEIQLLTINTGLAIVGADLVPNTAMEGAYAVDTDANGGAEYRGLKFHEDA